MVNTIKPKHFTVFSSYCKSDVNAENTYIFPAKMNGVKEKKIIVLISVIAFHYIYTVIHRLFRCITTHQCG